MMQVNNKYIAPSQAIILTAAFGIFYVLCGGELSSAGTALSNAVSSAVLMGLLLVPLALLMRNGGDNVPVIAADRLGIFGRVLCLLYTVYFISAASVFLTQYGVFVSERYLRELSPVVSVIMLGAVCGYISHTGIETVCRMSTVILFMLTVTGIAFIINGLPDIISCEFENIIPERISVSFEGIFPVCAAAVCALCVMCGGLGKNTRKAAFGGAAAILAASALAVTGVFAVLGHYAYASEYPLADAVIYAFREMSFRPDGVFFMLWTIIAAGMISLMCGCGGRALNAAFPRLKGGGIIAAAAALICSAFSLYGFDTGVIYRSPLWAVGISGVIPLILVFIPGKRRHRSA